LWRDFATEPKLLLIADAGGTTSIITTARISLNVRRAFLFAEKNQGATDFTDRNGSTEKQHP
jgi:hypothetical protein